MSSTKTSGKSSGKKKKSAPAAGFCCYIGPSILGVVQQNSIIDGSVEEARAAYADAIKKYPLISRMIVDGNVLAASLSDVKTPGTLLYTTYRKLAGK